MPRHAPHAVFTESSIYSSISIKKTSADSSLARLFPIYFHIWGKEFSEMLCGFFFFFHSPNKCDKLWDMLGLRSWENCF